MTDAARLFLLSADDYGLTAGVDKAIADLAAANRLSATSAIVTTAQWRGAEATVAGLRRQIAVGLHLNLTMGAPLGPMPGHAPGGRLPPVSVWIRKSLAGGVQTAEVEAEITRQFDAFEAVSSVAPDHVDGHHHVHALPGVRSALARVMEARYKSRPMPLIRLPGDSVFRICRRSDSRAKALLLTFLTLRAGHVFHRIGAPTNDGFSGFSSFQRSRDFAGELARFERLMGPAHMIMCHPGFSDPALEKLDPVALRRQDEFAALMSDATLPDRILHPAQLRQVDGAIDWSRLFGQ